MPKDTKKIVILILIWLLRRLLIVATIFCIAVSFSFFYGLSEIQQAELKGLIFLIFAFVLFLLFGDEYRDFKHNKIFKPMLDIFTKEIPLTNLLKLFIKWLIFAILAFFANKIIKTKLNKLYSNP